MDYKECVTAVRNAHFGSEVREPVADAIGRLPQLFGKHAVNLPEVTQARGGYSRLVERLDGIDETVGGTAPLVSDLKGRLSKAQADLKNIWEAGQ